MISGLAATPALLSASRTAFGLVGLDTGEVIDSWQAEARTGTAGHYVAAILKADCTQLAC